MVAIEPLTGARIPDQTDGPLGGLQIANVVEDLAPHVIGYFTTTADRDSKIAAFVAGGGVIRNGMVCWCDSPGSYYERQAGAWVPRARVVYGPNALDGTAVPSTARLVRVRLSNTTDVANTAGGFNIAFGFTFTKLMAVALWPGDATGPLGHIVPVTANHTLGSGHGVAYQPSGAVVPNGTTIRVEVDAVGYIL